MVLATEIISVLRVSAGHFVDKNMFQLALVPNFDQGLM